ncbi:hypothetical protein ABZ114_19480, partial [Streptomyces albidoflavus]|uniref:hypothetical protein n=1 Tax=Streptomyces albidoflavus TaxID=1886 RepID=UPI0033B53963
ADVWDAEGDLTALRAPFLPQESATALARFETAAAERSRHIPPAHLNGAVPIHGHEHVIGSGVLTPRHESTNAAQ